MSNLANASLESFVFSFSMMQTRTNTRKTKGLERFLFSIFSTMIKRDPVAARFAEWSLLSWDSRKQ